MAKKTYTVPYDDESRRWEPCEVRARVTKGIDRKPQKLYPGVRVEDDPNSAYPALANNVLLVDNTTIEARIEAGDQARITLKLNDGDPRIKEVLKRNSRFGLKIILNAEIDGGAGGQPKPGPDVEGFTTVLAQLPQTWDLTFRKTLWYDDGVIDLNKVEGVVKDDLQSVGNWGGRLILKPRGILQEEGSSEKVVSTKVIAEAGECVLDRDEGNTVKGEWDATLQAYVFQIEPSQQGETPAGEGGRDVEVAPLIKLTPGWERQLLRLLKSARKLSNSLAKEILQHAKRFLQGTLDLAAELGEQEIVDRKHDLNTWLLNIGNFISFMAQAAEMFNKALSLFGEAFKRFMDNMINFAIELCFAFFDLLEFAWKAAKGSVKTALKTSTKEMVEDLAEKSVKELGSQKEMVEQGVNAARRTIGSLDQELDTLWRQFPTDLSDPTPQMLRQMDELTNRAKAIMTQRDQLLTQITDGKKQVAELQANLAIAEEIKANAGEATEKEFLEKLQAKAVDLPQSPEIQQIAKDLDGLRVEDLAKLDEWHARVQTLIRQLPIDSQDQALRRLEQLANAFLTHREAVANRTLIDFNQNLYKDLLEKQPIGNRLKEVHEKAQKAKTAADNIHYENVAWEHYKGFFSPLWWFMDWSIAQVVWLYGLARDRWPWLAKAEALLAYAIDTFMGFFMQIINAMLDFMNSHYWTRSSISADVRSQGVSSASGRGVDAGFYNFPQSTKTLVQDCTPRKVHAMGTNGSQSQMLAAKQKLRSQAEGSYQQELTTQKQHARRLFETLCREALDVNHLSRPAPEQVRSSAYTSVWRNLASPMVQYEQAFAASNAQGTDYVGSIGRFAENSTFQDWDGAIEWLAWSVAWGLRLGGLLAVASGVGIAWVPAAFGAAQGVEWIAALLRPAVTWLGTMPDIIGFQYDVVIAAALAFEATMNGNVDLDSLVCESYYVE